MVLLLVAGIWTVLTTRLVRSVVGLALVSAVVSILIFRLNSPLAAAFELSVCAGLISVIFVTTISFTQRLTAERLEERRKERLGKYWYLPVILIIFGILLVVFKPKLDFPLPQVPSEQDTRNIIWHMRHVDLLGQILIILAGVFGVVILFKEPKK
ncbi:MAG: NADH-quinone oxidoreductase subunit J [Candidatus Omnitrophica bacterium]|nr:NADH-quinone oxidoreductase subunit J [Candidatus Omnitrophota bacterium]